MPIADFGFYAPTRARVGRGRWSAVVQSLSGKRVAVVTSPSVLRLELVEQLLAPLRGAVASIEIAGLASPNPRISEADAVAASIREHRLNAVLAIGGGSVLDCAKAGRVAAALGVNVRELVAAGRHDQDLSHSLPLHCVPTAFGTGAECSAGAIVTDERTGAKVAVRGEAVIPTSGFIEPAFALSLPKAKRVEIAFDILAHAIETYLSRASSPITDVLALAACDEIPALLFEYAQESPDEDVLLRVAMLSALMGFNLANSSTCLPHRMQYAVARVSESSHQVGLLAIYASWLRKLEARAVPRLTRALAGVRAVTVASGLSASAGASEAFTAFTTRLGLNYSLQSLGVHSTQLEALVGFVDGNVALDPLQPDRADIAAIFANALEDSA